VGDETVLGELPSTLKVQLAVMQNSDFIKSVSFFQHLDARIIATLVLCLRSRIYIPSETVLARTVFCEGGQGGDPSTSRGQSHIHP
jgi:hypothetical protein